MRAHGSATTAKSQAPICQEVGRIRQRGPPDRAGRVTQTHVTCVTFQLAFLPPNDTPTMIGMKVNELPLVLMFM